MADLDSPLLATPMQFAQARNQALSGYAQAGQQLASGIAGLPGAVEQGRQMTMNEFRRNQEREAIELMKKNPGLMEDAGKSTANTMQNMINEAVQSGFIEQGSAAHQQLERSVSNVVAQSEQLGGNFQADDQTANNFIKSLQGEIGNVARQIQIARTSKQAGPQPTPSQVTGAAQQVNPLLSPEAVTGSLAGVGAQQRQVEQARTAETQAKRGTLLLRGRELDEKIRQNQIKNEQDKQSIEFKRQQALINARKLSDSSQAVVSRNDQQIDNAMKEVAKQQKVIDRYWEQMKEEAAFMNEERLASQETGDPFNEQEARQNYVTDFMERNKGQAPLTQADLTAAEQNIQLYMNTMNRLADQNIDVMNKELDVPGFTPPQSGFVSPTGGTQNVQSVSDPTQTLLSVPGATQQTPAQPAARPETPPQTGVTPPGGDLSPNVISNSKTQMEAIVNQKGITGAKQDRLYKYLDIISSGQFSKDDTNKVLMQMRKEYPDVYEKVIRGVASTLPSKEEVTVSPAGVETGQSTQLPGGQVVSTETMTTPQGQTTEKSVAEPQTGEVTGIGTKEKIVPTSPDFKIPESATPVPVKSKEDSKAKQRKKIMRDWLKPVKSKEEQTARIQQMLTTMKNVQDSESAKINELLRSVLRGSESAKKALKGSPKFKQFWKPLFGIDQG